MVLLPLQMAWRTAAGFSGCGCSTMLWGRLVHRRSAGPCSTTQPALTSGYSLAMTACRCSWRRWCSSWHDRIEGGCCCPLLEAWGTYLDIYMSIGQLSLGFSFALLHVGRCVWWGVGGGGRYSVFLKSVRGLRVSGQ